jgi:hypothetical protein
MIRLQLATDRLVYLSNTVNPVFILLAIADVRNSTAYLRRRWSVNSPYIYRGRYIVVIIDRSFVEVQYSRVFTLGPNVTRTHYMINLTNDSATVAESFCEFSVRLNFDHMSSICCPSPRKKICTTNVLPSNANFIHKK